MNMAAAGRGRIPQLPDQVIEEILLLGPLKTVFKFKCLSRIWKFNVSETWFRLAYISLREESSPYPPPLLGFFHFKKERRLSIISGPGDKEAGPPEFSFLPTHLEGDTISRIDFMDRIGSFRCISNGLVLSGDYPCYYVFNPITHELFPVPRPNVDRPGSSSRIDWFDALVHDAAHPGFFSTQYDNDFKVVLPYVRSGLKKMHVNIDTYSSKTRLWRQSRVSAPDCFEISATLFSSTSGDGTFFWFTTDGSILAYNPEKDDNQAQLIVLPDPLSVTGVPPCLCLSADGLLQYAVDDVRIPGVTVYTLAKELSSYRYNHVISSGEWELACSLDLSSLDADWSFRYEDRIANQHHDDYVLLMSFDPLNPLILYFRMGPMIFSCNIVDGKGKFIHHRGRLYFHSTMFSVVPYVRLIWLPSIIRF